MWCLKYLKKSNSTMYSILQSEKKTLVNTVSRYYVVVYLQKGGVVPSNHSAGKLHLIKLPMNSEKSIKMRLHQECPTTHIFRTWFPRNFFECYIHLWNKNFLKSDTIYVEALGKDIFFWNSISFLEWNNTTWVLTLQMSKKTIFFNF